MRFLESFVGAWFLFGATCLVMFKDYPRLWYEFINEPKQVLAMIGVYMLIMLTATRKR